MSPVLRDALFWVAVASCAIAQLFIIRAVLRTAIRPSAAGSTGDTSAVRDKRADRPMPVPRRSIEIGWAILPAILMIAAFVSAWRLMHPEST
jgi:hypothetical protein